MSILSEHGEESEIYTPDERQALEDGIRLANPDILHTYTLLDLGHNTTAYSCLRPLRP
jgi:hypothetical protein